jgi:hypothetical protein
VLLILVSFILKHSSTSYNPLLVPQLLPFWRFFITPQSSALFEVSRGFSAASMEFISPLAGFLPPGYLQPTNVRIATVTIDLDLLRNASGSIIFCSLLCFVILLTRIIFPDLISPRLAGRYMLNILGIVLTPTLFFSLGSAFFLRAELLSAWPNILSLCGMVVAGAATIALLLQGLCRHYEVVPLVPATGNTTESRTL